jgi:hypothetical protein
MALPYGTNSPLKAFVGLDAAKPALTSAHTGYWYFAVDTGKIYQAQAGATIATPPTWVEIAAASAAGLAALLQAVGVAAGETSLAGRLTNLAPFFPFAGLGLTPSVVDALNILNAQIGDRQYTGGVLTNGETVTASLRATAALLEAGIIGQQLTSAGTGNPPVYEFLPANYLLYVTPATGNDANAGTSSGTALATLQEGLRRLAARPAGSIGALILTGALNLGSNPSIQIPSGGAFNGVPVVLDGGDPTVALDQGAYTTLVAGVAATGGGTGMVFNTNTPTWGTITTAAAPAANAWRGRRVRFTAGNAALVGKTFMVASNTGGGTVTLTSTLPAAPGAGDFFDVEEQANSVTWSGTLTIEGGSGSLVMFRGLALLPAAGASVRSTGPIAVAWSGMRVAGLGALTIAASEGSRQYWGGLPVGLRLVDAGTIAPDSGDGSQALGSVLASVGATSPSLGVGSEIQFINCALVSGSFNVSGAGGHLLLQSFQHIADASSNLLATQGARVTINGYSFTGVLQNPALNFQTHATALIQAASVVTPAASVAISARDRVALTLQFVGGAGAGTYGVQLDDGSHARVDTANVTITGATGDLQMAASGPIAWATVGAGPIFQLPDGNAVSPGTP